MLRPCVAIPTHRLQRVPCHTPCYPHTPPLWRLSVCLSTHLMIAYDTGDNLSGRPHTNWVHKSLSVCTGTHRPLLPEAAVMPLAELMGLMLLLPVLLAGGGSSPSHLSTNRKVPPVRRLLRGQADLQHKEDTQCSTHLRVPKGGCSYSESLRLCNCYAGCAWLYPSPTSQHQSMTSYPPHLNLTCTVSLAAKVAPWGTSCTTSPKFDPSGTVSTTTGVRNESCLEYRSGGTAPEGGVGRPAIMSSAIPTRACSSHTSHTYTRKGGCMQNDVTGRVIEDHVQIACAAGGHALPSE